MIITAGRALQSLIGIAAIRLLTTLLTPTQVGNYYLILAVMGGIILVLISPLATYINRRLHKWFEDGVLMWWLRGYHSYLVAVVLISMVIIYGLHKYLGVGSSSHVIGFVIVLTAYIYCITCNQNIILFVNMLGKRLGFVFFTSLTLTLGLACSAFYVMLVSPTALSWIFGQVTAMALVTPFALIYLRRVVHSNNGNKSPVAPVLRNDLPVVLSYAWPLLITYLFMWAQNLSYRVIIEKIVGPEFLGFVGVGLGIAAGLATALESVVHQIYLPVFYAEINTTDPKKRALAWNKMARVAIPLYLGFTILVSTLAPFVLRILADVKFSKAWVFLLCGAWVELFRMTTNILAGAAQSEMKTESLIKAYVWGAFVAILGTYFAARSDSREILIPAVLFFSGLIMTYKMYTEMNKLLKIEITSFGLYTTILYSSPLMLIPFLYQFHNNLYVSLAAVAVCGVYFILWQYKASSSMLTSLEISSRDDAQLSYFEAQSRL